MLIGVDPLAGKGLLVYYLNTCHLAMQSHIRDMHYKAGEDPGEVKWVNFHPPFSEPPSFLFLSLKY